MTDRFKGLGVALVTPFEEGLKVDHASLEKLVTHTISNGLDYFVVQGTTGESVTVTRKEKHEILHTINEINDNDKPVVFGCGGNNTSVVIEELKKLEEEKIDAILSVCPSYNKPSQKGLLNHFEMVADNSPFPVILYNVPGRTSVNLTAESTLLLANHENIIGIKEASGDLAQCIRISKNKPDDFLLISGDDLFTMPLISIGAVGVISVLGNWFTRLMKDIVDHGISGNLHKAQDALFILSEINPLMYEEGNPAGIKCVLSLAGITKDYVRPSLSPVSEELRAKIEAKFRKIA
ncbi:4-hydroxy-tetrahydrodipicolinate synthase [Bacteroidota bacterium]